jgi:preprotein translocase subunit SecG
MTTLLIILIVLASVILGLIVLVQNPKGGGLAGNIAGFSTQFMGVKQTNDVLERGTWIFAGVIALLSLASTFFISKTGTSAPDRVKDATGASVPAAQPQQPGANTLQLPPATTTDSNK